MDKTKPNWKHTMLNITGKGASIGQRGGTHLIPENSTFFTKNNNQNTLLKESAVFSRLNTLKNLLPDIMTTDINFADFRDIGVKEKRVCAYSTGNPKVPECIKGNKCPHFHLKENFIEWKKDYTTCTPCEPSLQEEFIVAVSGLEPFEDEGEVANGSHYHITKEKLHEKAAKFGHAYCVRTTKVKAGFSTVRAFVHFKLYDDALKFTEHINEHGFEHSSNVNAQWAQECVILTIIDPNKAVSFIASKVRPSKKIVSTPAPVDNQGFICVRRPNRANKSDFRNAKKIEAATIISANYKMHFARMKYLRRLDVVKHLQKSWIAKKRKTSYSNIVLPHSDRLSPVDIMEDFSLQRKIRIRKLEFKAEVEKMSAQIQNIGAVEVHDDDFSDDHTFAKYAKEYFSDFSLNVKPPVMKPMVKKSGAAITTTTVTQAVTETVTSVATETIATTTPSATVPTATVPTTPSATTPSATVPALSSTEFVVPPTTSSMDMDLEQQKFENRNKLHDELISNAFQSYIKTITDMDKINALILAAVNDGKPTAHLQEQKIKIQQNKKQPKSQPEPESDRCVCEGGWDSSSEEED